MNIFLTGPTGYIGSIVAQRLKETGHNVFGLTRSEASAQKLKFMINFSDRVVVRKW